MHSRHFNEIIFSFREIFCVHIYMCVCVESNDHHRYFDDMDSNIYLHEFYFSSCERNREREIEKGNLI